MKLTERSAKTKHALILGFVIDDNISFSGRSGLDEVNGRRRLQRGEELGSIPRRLVLEEGVDFSDESTAG